MYCQVYTDGRVNDLQINNSDYYFSNVFGGPSELQVWDATVIRLQEASLSYNLPKKFLDNTPFGPLRSRFQVRTFGMMPSILQMGPILTQILQEPVWAMGLDLIS